MGLGTEGGLRRVIGTWAALLALVGAAVVVDRAPDDEEVAAANGPRRAPAVSGPSTTGSVSLPDLTTQLSVPSPSIPGVTLPTVPLPTVTLPPVTLPAPLIPEVLDPPPFEPPTTGLWLVEADAPNGVRLLAEPAFDATFSPDGTRLAATVSTNEIVDGHPQQALVTVGTDGGEPVRIVPEARFPTGPAWSPDGEWIAFRAFPSPDSACRCEAELWLVRPGGGDPHILAFGDVGRLAWSPNSTTVAQPRPNHGDLLVVSVADGASRSIPFPDGHLLEWLDQDHLVVSGYDGPTAVIDLTTGGRRDLHPAWRQARPRPGGQWVAFRSHGVGGQVGVVPTGGGLPTFVTEGSPVGWSPDGHLLSASLTNAEILVVDIDTLHARPVARGAPGRMLSASRWSPTERRLLVPVSDATSVYSP